MWQKYAFMSKAQESVIKRYLGKPVSFVLKKKRLIPNVVAKEKVGGRITSHPIALKLVKELGKPLISTSANKSGSSPCYSISCVKKQGLRVDYYLDTGVLEKKLPTTVYDLVENKTLRKGSVEVVL